MAINSGKYKIEGEKLVNIATGIAIPDDEPVFVFRAADMHLIPVLGYYASMCGHSGLQQSNAVYAKVVEIQDWQKANPDKVKEPD